MIDKENMKVTVSTTLTIGEKLQIEAFGVKLNSLIRQGLKELRYRATYGVGYEEKIAQLVEKFQELSEKYNKLEEDYKRVRSSNMVLKRELENEDKKGEV